MASSANKVPAQAASSRFVPDTVMAPMIGVSVAFLQKDRRGAKQVPFIRLGDRCLYDPDAVIKALEGYVVGGPSARRGRRGSCSV